MRWLICMPAILAIVACAEQHGVATAGGEPLTPAVRSAKSQFRVVYSFKGPPDGANPAAGPLTVLDGKLYGTTRRGGNSGQGTVVEINLDGSDRVLHSFSRQAGDGSEPLAGMVEVNGALYGTTPYGGKSKFNLGTVFEIKRDGSERVIYEFDGYNGAEPHAGLTTDAGVLYGTTFEFGQLYYGTLYALSTEGRFKLLHSWGRVDRDGARPVAAPTFFRGHIYGTTLYGPKEGAGPGIVYEINVTGKPYRKVHIFGENGDGYNPYCRLVALNGALYGTTERGGTFGKGTIFKVTSDGTETVLHSFEGADGISPRAGLAVFEGMLFGETPEGGASGNGVIFEISPEGKYRVLHDFDGKDGSNGVSELLPWNGKLYGTTFAGGASHDGTVFEITR
jgi:uncharacterized repeat protein (TIGR03803 family)